MKWLILLLGIVASGFASVMIKMATMPPRNMPNAHDLSASLSNWPFWVGLTLYGVAFIIYALALERLPLNIVHPVMTIGAVVFVVFLSVLFFSEPLSWALVIGISFALFGVILIYVSGT